MDKLDLLGRTSEMARLFGIDFFSVLSRGSQYRVEAVMLRCLTRTRQTAKHKKSCPVRCSCLLMPLRKTSSLMAERAIRQALGFRFQAFYNRKKKMFI